MGCLGREFVPRSCWGVRGADPIERGRGWDQAAKSYNVATIPKKRWAQPSWGGGPEPRTRDTMTRPRQLHGYHVGLVLPCSRASAVRRTAGEGRGEHRGASPRTPLARQAPALRIPRRAPLAISARAWPVRRWHKDLSLRARAREDGLPVLLLTTVAGMSIGGRVPNHTSCTARVGQARLSPPGRPRGGNWQTRAWQDPCSGINLE